MIWSRAICFTLTRNPQQRFSALITVARSMATTANAGLESSHLTLGGVVSSVQSHSCATQSPHFMYWDADDVDGELEDIHRYTTGGFHPIRLGDILSSKKSQYRVLHKLGQGSFSTVWLAEVLQESFQRYAALKVCVAKADAKHELEIFNRLSRTLPAPPNVMHLRDHFSLQGPNGVHTVLVSDPLGNPLSMIDSPNGIGRKHMRKLCRDITVGLAALHSRGTVHGDLHPRNIGVSLPTLNNHSAKNILLHFGNPACLVVLPETQPVHPETLPPYLVVPISVIDYLMENDKSAFEEHLHAEIMDLGNAIIVDEQTRPACTAAGVLCPELTFERIVRPSAPRLPPTRASDIWSLGCTIYKLVSGKMLFPFPFSDSILSRMATLCGEVPQEWEKYPESQEQLRGLAISHAIAEAEWNDRLQHFTKGPDGPYPEADVKELFALLRSMLMIDPTQRPSAEEVLKHPWFSHDET